MKIVLISVDGMRPDALAGITQVENLKKTCHCTMNAKTVFPSVTLPCHLSMFLSVGPERHGTTTNEYSPQVRPVKGLCEVLRDNNKSCAFFYDWAELRDLSRPDSLDFSYMRSYYATDCTKSANLITAAADIYLNEEKPDFAFVYYLYPDLAGHYFGWMSNEYIDALHYVWQKIEELISGAPEGYSFIITSDHGGHLRGHGSDMDEDMTIPAFFVGDAFREMKNTDEVSIKDMAPTIAGLLGCERPAEWEGKSLV